MPVRQKKEKPVVPYAERCEAVSSAGPHLTNHCKRRGEMCEVRGAVAQAFSRLCSIHQKTFTKSGLIITPLTPVEKQAAGAVGL
jgi:hypothetical protein